MIAFILLFCGTLIGSGSAQHAYCNMTLTVKSTTISALNASLVKMVQSRQGFTSSTCVYASMQNEFCGYSVVSVSASLDHFQHETPTHHYVDDIEFFDWKQSGSDVVVGAGSRSEPTSLYDYDTNFCNIFNLFRNGNVSKLNFDFDVKYDGCPFHPSTSNGYGPAYTTCNTY
mmetsp:Transcript_39308/g.62792  ORF Transcript_39308/g.62792 Transcript_39308/m.62792 type:complete len:172 (+) Transcript_39308:123-638(+)|eukprot:CAMPEP_0197031954 /NCGR_PEP_ID=MMETSP1384-20130603/10764_1 /TAXON_ID=29189 /ORGANISM="Ammonia sp." /LENGTH=171 /DNA_ID=CAMNT_0042461541 /DNA_START=79 /DNA_END=594 /DNA_ORIENTATION=-